MSRAYLIESGVVVQKGAPGSTASGRDGWVDGPDNVFCGYLWDGETFTRPPPPPPTAADVAADVAAEWERRVDIGGVFTVPGVADPIPVPGRQPYREVIQAKLSAAQLFKAQGVSDPVMRFRDGANVEHMLTPDQTLSLCLQSMQFYESLSSVYWAMKDGTGDFTDGIPDNFTDDEYWI